QPVPRRVRRHRIARGVLAEVADEVALARGRLAAEPRDPRGQVVAGVCATAEGELRTEEAELLPPGVGEELIVQLGPARDRRLHAAFFPGRARPDTTGHAPTQGWGLNPSPSATSLSRHPLRSCVDFAPISGFRHVS